MVALSKLDDFVAAYGTHGISTVIELMNALVDSDPEIDRMARELREALVEYVESKNPKPNAG